MLKSTEIQTKDNYQIKTNSRDILVYTSSNGTGRLITTYIIIWLYDTHEQQVTVQTIHGKTPTTYVPAFAVRDPLVEIHLWVIQVIDAGRVKYASCKKENGAIEWHS